MILYTFLTAASAQTVYSTDLDELNSALRSIMAKTERAQPTNYDLINAIHTESQRLLENLIEIASQSTRDDLSMMKKGAKSDRELLLTASIADALILALNLNSKFLYTRDKLFWNQALAAVNIAKILRAGTAKQQ